MADSKNPFLIAQLLERAMKTAGAITMFVAVCSFGIAAFFVGASRGQWIAYATLGFVGALESFHAQRKGTLKERSQDRETDAVFRLIAKAQPNWHMESKQQLSYGGFHFNAVGFKEHPLPIFVTSPLCPRCHSQGHLSERAEVRFPGRVRITLFCRCGFSQRTPETMAELRQIAMTFCGHAKSPNQAVEPTAAAPSVS
jgi:hypothetical protein